MTTRSSSSSRSGSINGPFDGHPDRPAVPWAGHQAEPRCRRAITRCRSARRRWCARAAAVTVLAYGTMVHVALAAAEEAGIDAEIIDLRTLLPLDIDTIVDSVKKTGRCVIAHEATRTCGFGAELSALVQEHCFYHLEAPIVRVTGWDTPYPHAHEWDYFPGPAAPRRRHAPGARRLIGDRNGPLCRQGAGYRRGHDRGRDRRLACRAGSGDPRGGPARRCDDRQGDRRISGAGRRHGRRDPRQARREAAGRLGAGRARCARRGQCGGRAATLTQPAASAAGLPLSRDAGEGAAPAPAATLRPQRGEGRARRHAADLPSPRMRGEGGPRAAARAGEGQPSARAARPVRAPSGRKPLASPAVRRRAWDLGIELQFVPGSGPGGRITHEDLDAYVAVPLGRGSAPSRRGRRRGATGSRRCRSSACAARSPSICRNRSGRSRISPMSRRSMSPRSRNCAPR